MNAKKLLTAVLALVLVCGLAACSSMQKDNMMDNAKEPVQSDTMEGKVMENTDGMTENECMCGEDSKCMNEGMCNDGCMCMEDGMCTEECKCMDGGCMKDGMCMDGCMCSENNMIVKELPG